MIAVVAAVFLLAAFAGFAAFLYLAVKLVLKDRP